MNGARIGRRGKLQGGRQGSAASRRLSSDPFGTGLMIAAGTPTVIRWRAVGVDGNRRRQARRSAPRRATRAGPGRAASPLAANVGKPRGNRAAASAEQGASGLLAAEGAPPALRAPGGEPAAQGDRQAGGCARQPWRRRRGRSRRQQGRRAAGKGAGGQAGKSAGQGGNKSRSSRGSAPRGDDWQRAAPARTSRAWACWVAAGSSGALSPGRRLLGVVPPSWRSGCWRACRLIRPA